MTKEHEELKCSHDDLVQQYDSVLIEQRNNDDALSCVAQLKMENAMLERQVELLSHDKLALTEKYDLLSYYHDNLLDRHIMLDVAHEVVIANLNSCEPHSCTRAHLDNISPCANPCCSKESQLLNEHQAAGSKEKVLINKERSKKTKQLRRRRIAQPSQDIHGCVVKKLETGETVASVKLHKKYVPKTKNEEINMNKEKGKDSISHVVCTDHLSMSSKNKKRKGKRRCFKCNKSGHLIASCPYNDKDEGMRRCFRCNDKDHMITSCPLMKNQARATSGMTPTKKEDKQQASCQVKRHFCYMCGEHGHLSKVCKKGKVPKQVNLSQSHSLRRPKPYTCARSVMRSPRTSTIAIWVPKALLDDRYGPIPRWVPNCTN
jgi:hypothetical protein